MSTVKRQALDGHGFGRRAHPRAPLDSEAVLSTDPWTCRGEMRDISVAGAFVTTPAPLPTVGQGVRIEFRLPGGPDLSLCATVRWVRPTENDLGSGGFGVQFLGVGRTEQSVLNEFVGREIGEQRPSALHATAVEKFLIEVQGDTVRFRLCGTLREEEGRELLEQTRRQLTLQFTGRLLTYIDAGHLVPCPDESLGALKRWLICFREQKAFYGVIVVKSAVATLQIRRLAREVGIAESLACFDDEAQAMPFWNDIRTQLGDHT
jgi:hypothetical protein